MRRAVIDLGTNSVLLLIGQPGKRGNIEVLEQRYTVSRLGERVFDTGELQAGAMERTMAVLEMYAREIEKRQVDEIHLLGTEALRRAENIDQFKELIRKQLSWELQIISAEQEARFSFMGAAEAVKDRKETPLVMDVGGGSTEIILGKDAGRLQSVSLPLGAVKLAEFFKFKEKLEKKDQDELQKMVRAQLEQVSFLHELGTGQVLIGVGGTITTLAACSKHLPVYDPEQINGCVLGKDELTELFRSLNRLTAEQRRRQAGIDPGREDIILYGAMIFLEMMNYSGFERIVVSDRGLRFGYFRYIEGTKAQTKQYIKNN